MSPAKLAKDSEHSHQVALFAWAAVVAYRGFKAAWDMKTYESFAHAETYGVLEAVHNIKWLHAIPNGAMFGDTVKARAIRGGAMKAEGLKPGIADVFLPLPIGQYAGLYIEMKKPGKIKDTSPEQKEFGAYARTVGYAWIVYDNWKDAAAAIEFYITYGVMPK